MRLHLLKDARALLNRRHTRPKMGLSTFLERRNSNMEAAHTIEPIRMYVLRRLTWGVEEATAVTQAVQDKSFQRYGDQREGFEQ
jgi:hypothetical protein